MDISKLTGSTQGKKYVAQSAKELAEQKSTKPNQIPGQSSGQDKVEISAKAMEAQANPSSRTESILKMTESERTELVSKLREEQQRNMAKMFDFVRETLASQGTTLGKTDDMWKFIASGDYKVDAQTKLDAQQAISEDGFYGVKQTSERIFEFALALTGGDEKQMQKMEEAISKGFSEAEKAWGGALPGITADTREAINQRFDDYYASLNPEASEG